ncbi:DNA polymerase alpha catalytic subunit [Venturia canescens]|uniref:DNA polymerase alpha catalytic subunit n=1 Tax=Venturia canescens TaxID=32260 RepID=UPI001C9CEC9B|nr:DNA polymerase alpha catalytic subunit [Venturia canescens]
MDDSEPTSSGRSKRQKNDKTGRLSALEKLKNLKGSKHKYQVSEVDNVYDEVDEKIYSKTVMERQNDDWIVDDGGSGYVEDGREIFDDDLDDDSIHQAAKQNSLAGPRKRKKDETKSKGNIKNMLMSMPSKKKADDKLNDDDILGDLMNELQKDEPAAKRKDTKVRNKFATAQVSKSQPATKAKPMDVDDFLEPMFESCKKIKPALPVEEKKINNTKQVHTPSSEQSISQIIETDLSQNDVVDNESCTIESCLSPEPQNESNQFDDNDLSNLDFDEIELNIENLPTSTAKTMTQPESTEAESKTPKEIEAVGCFRDQKVDDMEVVMMDQVWADDFNEQLTEAEVSSSNVEAEIVPPVTDKTDGTDDQKSFRFFWWDAYEDQYKQPGVVYLFGKTYDESTKAYVSCCVQVKNIPRRIYLLPREQIKNSGEEDSEQRKTILHDVYKEFNEWATKKNITQFAAKFVTKLYAFERAETPRESEYVEIRYPATCPAMDVNYEGPAIEHVFGTSVNALELFLIETNIKGPCWLEVKKPLPSGNPSSWCKSQINCLNFEDISVYKDKDAKQKLPIPPMSMATLNVRMSLNQKRQQNEVIMIGILLHNDYRIDKPPPKPLFQQHYCLVTHPRDMPWPRHARDLLSKTKNTRVLKCETEYDLLEQFLSILEKTDPDLVVGYDCGFQFDVLLHRISSLKVKNWSRIGKLRRNVMPLFKGKINLAHCFCGRPISDIQLSAKELSVKVRSFDLQSLCCSILKKSENECKEIKPADCPKFYAEADKIEKLLQITMNEALSFLTILFELNVMPLAVQITCLAGNTLSRTLAGGRAERNEFLLLHAFFQKDYITPDKRIAPKTKEATDPTASKRKKPAYTGGLVLEPKKGFYDKLILLMDFNSLYPSIIQEYNLCFTTVPGAAYDDLENLNLPTADLPLGIVPTEIRKLVQSRIEVKKLMNAPNISPELKLQYNTRQMALKLTANSMYGCLGASHCRFYAKGMAALITSKGREILQNTKSLVEKLNFEVIYGDTDSIMINTNNLNYDETFAIAKKIKQEVNKLYQMIELDIDGVFRYLLLLHKKKYAALILKKLPNGKMETTMEHKGLDIVRRDWCQLACDTGKKILDELFTDQSNDSRREKIFEILQTVAAGIRSAQVPLSSLVVTKQLSKNPKDYPAKKLAHVSVALRLNKEGGRMWKAGDTVPYVICEDGTSRSATERAYHVDEFKKSDTLKIDIDYYLLQQILPVVLRICEPIENIDDVLLSTHLGLENVYKSKRVIHEQVENPVPSSLNEERFHYCIPLKIKCRNDKCNTEIEIKEFFADFPTGKLPALARCSNPACDLPPYKNVKSIQNEIHLKIRYYITEYYADWLECEDPICSNRTRFLPMNVRGCYPRCDVCKDGLMHRVYNETSLYEQINYFHRLLDVNEAGKKFTIPSIPEMISVYDHLKEFVEKQLARSAYSLVDLNWLFCSNFQKSLAVIPVNEEEEEEAQFDFSDDEMIPDVEPTEIAAS